MKKKILSRKNISIKNIISKKNKPIFLFILTGIFFILILIILGFYFLNLIKQERIMIRESLNTINQTTSEPNNIVSQVPAYEPYLDQGFSESFIQAQSNKIPRFFLSDIKIINSLYTPIVHTCLFQNGEPIYPRYIYETWSSLSFPTSANPEITLVKYSLLPEDNANFQPNSDCFIKEIKTEEDWREIGQKYNFYRARF